MSPLRRCPRCSGRKPEANFKAFPQKSSGQTEFWCDHCRSLDQMLRKASPSFPFQAEPIAPTPEDAELIALARAEREAFVARGAPRFERPYISAKGYIYHWKAGKVKTEGGAAYH